MRLVVLGSTGTAGGAVLQRCLATARVTSVRAISRRPLSFSHPKLRTFIHEDFLNYAPIRDAFVNADACLFCLGKSVSQVADESAYRRITHDFAVAASAELASASPIAVFHYLSGQSASLTSRMMWARVKAETERDLMASAGAVCWRPGFIDGADSASAPRGYQIIRPLFRLLRPFRSLYVAGEDIGRAMMQATLDGIRGRIIENREIRAIADRFGRDEARLASGAHS